MAKSRTQTINKLVWLDLEMTGLDLDKDVIMEISILITTPKLRLIDKKGFSGVASITEEQAAAMDPFVYDMHEKNGLLEESLNSKVSESEVEEQALEYLQKHVEKDEAPLCGNSISTDRAFIMKRLHKIDDHLHYRNVDVTTFKQMLGIYKPDLEYKKTESDHRALSDIRASIDQMKFYANEILK